VVCALPSRHGSGHGYKSWSVVCKVRHSGIITLKRVIDHLQRFNYSYGSLPMSFPESLTKDVRRRAHFQCCLCKTLGIEIHHITPQAEGGSDTFENAAPLCPTCHETYGANPTKRKFIREARDLWFEICEKRYAPDSSVLYQVHEVVTKTAS
jgi:hypothetical protein